MIFNNNKGLVIEIWLKMNKLALSGFVCIVNDMAYSDMSLVFRISAYVVVVAAWVSFVTSQRRCITHKYFIKCAYFHIFFYNNVTILIIRREIIFKISSPLTALPKAYCKTWTVFYTTYHGNFSGDRELR